ncbi:MAG: ABC transporter ATP-binding protein [Planctomycetes bacterium]|nr:ABC transporter ATP-binding protein [Planctomycetota bacterium]
MSHFSYILKILRRHRKRMILSLLAMLGIMLVDLGSPLVIAILIDNVISLGSYHLLAPLMLFFLALPFASAVCRIASDYTITLLGQRVVFDIRLDLYRHVHKLHCQYIQEATTGKIMERIRGDVNQIQNLLTNNTPQLLVQVVTGLIMVSIMLTMSVKLTLMMFAGILLYLINYRIMVPRIRKIQRRYRRKMDRLSAYSQERLAGTLVVKSFNRERFESRNFIKRNFLAERVFHRFRTTNLTYNVISGAITWGNYVLIIVVGTLLVIRGELTYGAVTAMTAFSFRLLYPASMLAELSNQLQQASVSLDRIFELMNAEKDIPEVHGLRLAKVRGEVVFDHVNFQYEEGKPVLRDLCLHVRAGQTVALVGQTGCGKTTLVNLIYRYHKITDGRLLIDGKDINSLDIHAYRRCIAMVPQEPIIFDATLGENIGYGNPKASRKDLERAARMAELGGVLDRLEHGLDSRLGAEFVTLSVGERQRLCIARAILANPTILILDEATSSLDTHSEKLIQIAMERVMADRTCFVIAHRLSTIVNSDLIVVMDGGQVLEQGTHAELMARPDGRYKFLYTTQTDHAGIVRTA